MFRARPILLDDMRESRSPTPRSFRL